MKERLYQSVCLCLCAVNDFPRPPVLCGPPCLHPGRHKKRIVRVGEQLRRRAEGPREEEGRDTAYRKQTRPYSTKASKDEPSLLPLKSPFFSLCPHHSCLHFLVLSLPFACCLIFLHVSSLLFSSLHSPPSSLLPL